MRDRVGFRAKIGLALAALLVGAVEARAANHYVRQGATGNGSGDDWTNAYTTLPATLVRGDVYYFAAGSYSAYTFNDAASGATVITIKKATAADPGTTLGWTDTYGAGVATFTGPLNFTTSNYVVDGMTGGGPNSWTTGFGFKISHSGATPLLRVGSVSNISVRHIELQGTSNSAGGGSIAQDAVAVYGGGGVTLSYFYTHAIGRCPFFLVPAPDITIEYGYVGTFVATSAAHAEVISTQDWNSGNLTFRYNLVTHIEGTGGIMWDNSGNHNSQARIYGNVFYRAANDSTWTEANGVIGGWTGNNGEDCYNLRVYNNTFYNVNQLVFTDFITRSGNNDASNNIFYNSDAPSYADIQTHNYNHYIASGGTQSEPNGTSAASGDPFVSAAGLDFRLRAATGKGLALAAPFNVDMYGNVRGADGTWDRGAVEFTNGSTTAPPPAGPVNLRIIR